MLLNSPRGLAQPKRVTVTGNRVVVITAEFALGEGVCVSQGDNLLPPNSPSGQ